MIAGRATPEGTKRFAERSNAAPGHFRQGAGLLLSSIGLGTYLGAEDAATDSGIEACVGAALSSGVNVFDSAINYRGQKSERAVGRALAAGFASGLARREEVFVSTKGGYLPHDSDDPRDARAYIVSTFVDAGLAPREEIVRGGHCMSARYLTDQIDRSRENLGLETIDLYYLHNIETQRAALDLPTFGRRLREAIALLESAAAGGRIAAWGLATWDGLRVPPEHPEHLSLAEVREAARGVAGERHHFRAVQMPVNLAMPQAIVYPSQETPEGRLPPLEAARALGLAAFGSASILQGRLAAELPEEIEKAFPEARAGAQKALQFSRSAPGITTSLIGVSHLEHAREDFGLAGVPPAEPARVMALFG